MSQYTSPVTGNTYEGEHQFYAPNNPVSALADWLTKDMRRMSDEFWSDDVSRQEFTNRYGPLGYPLGFIGGVFSRPINKVANQQELDFQDYLELGLTATATPLGQFLYRSGKIAADPALQAIADSKAGSAIGAALDDLYARTMDFLHSPAPMLRDKVHKHDPSRREAMRNVGVGTAAAIIGAPAISTIVKKGAPLVGEFAKDAATIAHAPLASAATHASSGAQVAHWGGFNLAEDLIEKSSGKKSQMTGWLDQPTGYRDSDFTPRDMDAFKHTQSGDGYHGLFSEAQHYSDFLDWAARRKGIERASTKSASDSPTQTELLSDSYRGISPQERGGRLIWDDTKTDLETMEHELDLTAHLQRDIKRHQAGEHVEGWEEIPLEFPHLVDPRYPDDLVLEPWHVTGEDGIVDVSSTMERYLKAQADEQADIMARDTKRIFESDDELAEAMIARYKEGPGKIRDLYKRADALQTERRELQQQLKKLQKEFPIPPEWPRDFPQSRAARKERIAGYKRHEKEVANLKAEIRRNERLERDLHAESVREKRHLEWLEKWADGQFDAQGNRSGGLRQHFGWEDSENLANQWTRENI